MKRPAIVALCCVVAAGVASTASPVASRSDTTLDLCAVRASIQSAAVLRSSSLGGRSFTFPAHVSIPSKLRARAIASAVCGLPPFPSRPRCPADYGVRYLVRFSGPNLRVSIDPSGCETVTGAGAVRWVATSPGFWRTLGHEMGLPAANSSTFRGRPT
jgi:hypothetical protein